MSFLKSISLAASVLIGTAGVAAAAPVTFNFGGVVTEDTVGAGALGQAFQGTMTYDLPPVSAVIAASGGTSFFETTGSLTMTVGAYSWTNSTNLSIQARDDWSVGPNFYDAIIAFAGNPFGKTFGTKEIVTLQLSLITPFLPAAPDLVVGGQLPTGIDVNDLNVGPFSSNFSAIFRDSADQSISRIYGGGIVPAPVPLPAGGLLLLTGLALAGAAARRGARKPA